jgi:hypothetical protein
MVWFAAETVYYENPEFVNTNGRLANLVMSAIED